MGASLRGNVAVPVRGSAVGGRGGYARARCRRTPYAATTRRTWPTCSPCWSGSRSGTAAGGAAAGPSRSVAAPAGAMARTRARLSTATRPVTPAAAAAACTNAPTARARMHKTAADPAAPPRSTRGATNRVHRSCKVVGVPRVHADGAAEALGAPRKLAEDEDTRRLLLTLARHILVAHEVHSVTDGRHDARVGHHVQRHQLLRCHAAVDVADGRVVQRPVQPVHTADQLVHLAHANTHTDMSAWASSGGEACVGGV